MKQLIPVLQHQQTADELTSIGCKMLSYLRHWSARTLEDGAQAELGLDRIVAQNASIDSEAASFGTRFSAAAAECSRGCEPSLLHTSRIGLGQATVLLWSARVRNRDTQIAG